jgi:hypothetical protein
VVKALDYTDLIGRPYEEMGCVAICNEVLDRLGLPAVAPETDDEIAHAAGLVRSRVARSDWRYLGDDILAAKMLGDIVVTDTPDEHGQLQLHTSVIVNAAPCKILTTTPRDGVIVFRAGFMRGVVAVYRAKAVKA